ncbi:MAG TPA: SAM-dependent methyltransferase [Thermoanaerobaculales bacterium]|nr:SAM-dependent methyltransferase [Thermoanaerobaculales bacterium]
MSWIAREIAARGGEVSFRDYMELALYHPRHGYYSAATPRYGRGGDFLTAPTASPWYAVVLAGLVERLAARAGPVCFLDVASGDGALLVDLLSAMADGGAAAIREACSVERSSPMRAAQLARLGGAAKVPIRVVASLEEVERTAGPVVVHACELYDALPVHRVVMRPGGLSELRVAAVGDACRWSESPAGGELDRYFASHGVRLEPGQIAEARLDAERLHSSLLELAGGDGLAVITDYGYEARRLYDPRGRRGGSLAVQRAHRVSRDPFLEPGERDLSAHVNWDDLRRAADAAGWREIALTGLAPFLIRAGLAGQMERLGVGEAAGLDARTVAERQEIKRLLDPDGMGSDLKVLVQGKGPLADAAAEDLGSGI